MFPLAAVDAALMLRVMGALLPLERVTDDGDGVGHVMPEGAVQVKLTGPPVSLTFSADNRYAFSSVQSQDKIFVIPLATRKIENVIAAPAGSGPDPYLPLR